MGGSATARVRHALHALRRATIPPASPRFARRPVRTSAGSLFRPLILGGDIGGLSQARAYYETFGVQVPVVARSRTPIHSASSMFELVYEPHLDQPDRLIEVVNGFAAQDPSPVLVTSSFDAYVQVLVDRRDQLVPNVLVPYASADLIDLALDKVAFSRLAEELGICYPRTIIYRAGSGPVPDLSGLGWPLVAKAANNDDVLTLDLEGREKVSFLASQDEAEAYVERLLGAGFRGDLLFQERVPGSDQQMRILTCYIARDGSLVTSVYGHSVVEEHDPELRGNPALILTGIDDDAVAQQAGVLLRRLGWTGFANFDLKVDPRDGRARFFELNPRLGRSNYYLTVAGVNPIALMVEDWVDGRTPSRVRPRSGTGVYTVVPLVLALAYGRGVRGDILGAIVRGRVRNPLVKWIPHRRDVARVYYMLMTTANQYRRFHRHYPLRRMRTEDAAV